MEKDNSLGHIYINCPGFNPNSPCEVLYFQYVGRVDKVHVDLGIYLIIIFLVYISSSQLFIFAEKEVFF